MSSVSLWSNVCWEEVRDSTPFRDPENLALAKSSYTNQREHPKCKKNLSIHFMQIWDYIQVQIANAMDFGEICDI